MRKNVVTTKGSIRATGQPTFYVGDRNSTNMDNDNPYSFRHKIVVGPWKDRRALIECLFGYHNFCKYSSSSQDIVFDPKAQSRAFRAYIKGYYWKDFVDAEGDVEKCIPLADNTIIGVNQWIVVSSHLLPPWAPRYLPNKRYTFIKDKVPEKIGNSSFSTATTGGDVRDAKDHMDYPRNRWEHEYWPKGMPHRVKWKRKHFSNFSDDDKSLCQKYYSALPESNLQPGQPFTRDFKTLFKKVKDREENVVPSGIPKTMMTSIMETKMRKKHEDEAREVYQASCQPCRPRFPNSARKVLMQSRGYSSEKVYEMEREIARHEAERQQLCERKKAGTTKQEHIKTFESLFAVEESDDEQDQKETTKPKVKKRKSSRIVEPHVVDEPSDLIDKLHVSDENEKKPKERSTKRSTKPKGRSTKRSTKPKGRSARPKIINSAKTKTQTPLRRSSRLRNRHT